MLGAKDVYYTYGNDREMLTWHSGYHTLRRPQLTFVTNQASSSRGLGDTVDLAYVM